MLAILYWSQVVLNYNCYKLKSLQNLYVEDLTPNVMVFQDSIWEVFGR